VLRKAGLQDAMTPFSVVLRWMELSSLTTRYRFPGSFFLSKGLAWLRTGAFCRRNLRDSNAQ